LATHLRRLLQPDYLFEVTLAPRPASRNAQSPPIPDPTTRTSASGVQPAASPPGGYEEPAHPPDAGRKVLTSARRAKCFMKGISSLPLLRGWNFRPDRKGTPFPYELRHPYPYIRANPSAAFLRFAVADQAHLPARWM
jgi:hypothetical protein